MLLHPPSGRIILASASPRRQMLMNALGIDFEIIVKEIDETCPGKAPVYKIAACLAEMKSDEFQPPEIAAGDVVITADTIVVLDGKVIGKPGSREEAIGMLTSMAGTMHKVYTGVCLRSTAKKVVFTEMSKVWFTPLTRLEIEHYVDQCQPYDKAGAYGIQEWIGYAAISRIEGSFFNVMGLPTHKLYRELLAF